MTQALLIVDIQNDYFPGGAMELVGSVEASRRAAALLAAFRSRGLPVIHVLHVSLRPGATFFLPDTEGAKIHASVAPAASETVIEKHFPNSFRETPLLDHLRCEGIDRLAFECQLAHDACATRELAFAGAKVAAKDVHNAFVAALNGPFAKALSAQE